MRTLLLLALAAVQAFGAFSFKRTVTIDHTKCGAADSANFPMAVAGTLSYLATVANGGSAQNANGYDVGFYSDSGLTTKLKWETVTYTAASGLVEYWVKVPTVSHTVDTVIYLAYGDSSISTDQSDHANVWTGLPNSAVYHFGDGTTLGLGDSTSQALTLTNSGAVAAAGKIGGSIATTSAHFANTTSTVSGFASDWSLSVWVNTTNSTAGNEAIHVSTQTGAGMEDIQILTSGFAKVGDAGGGSGRAIGTSNCSNGAWHYVVGTYISGTFRIYVDGSLQTTQAASKLNSQDGIWIGRQNDGSVPFVGSIDEVHIIGGAGLSADWITAEYNNQNSPSTFYTVSAATGQSAGVRHRAVSQ